MKRRGGLQQNFLYKWNRHLQAELAISLVSPQAVKMTRNNRFYTSILEHFSLLFHWSQAGSTCGAPNSVLSSFQRRGPVTYTLFLLQPPYCAELQSLICQHRNVLLRFTPPFSYSWRGSCIELDPSGGSPWLGFGPLACCFRGKRRPVTTNVFVDRFFQQFSFEKGLQ